MDKEINVGLLGFGMAGSMFHAPFIANVAGLRLQKIKANRAESIALANARYPAAEVVAHEQDIFNDAAIDLVVVATTSPTHYHMAKAALQAGKHVLVDKPFKVTSAEADELIALAREKGKLLTVYQNRRWDSDFKTVRKVLSQQLLGELVEYEAHFDRFRNEVKPGTWKEEDLPGTGILYDLGTHLIDQALCLFGEPLEVQGDVRALRKETQVADYAEVTLRFQGVKAILKASMLVREQGPHFILHGTKGSFIKYGMDMQEEHLKQGKSPADTPDWGTEPESLWGTLNTDVQGLHVKGKVESKSGDYTGLYENVYRAILGQEELQVKPEQARNTIRIIELALQSSKEKRSIKFS